MNLAAMQLEWTKKLIRPTFRAALALKFNNATTLQATDGPLLRRNSARADIAPHLATRETRPIEGLPGSTGLLKCSIDSPQCLSNIILNSHHNLPFHLSNYTTNGPWITTLICQEGVTPNHLNTYATYFTAPSFSRSIARPNRRAGRWADHGYRGKASSTRDRMSPMITCKPTMVASAPLR